MKDLELVIKIPQKWFDDMVREEFTEVDELCAVIQHGTLLPKGYGKLISEAEILKFLKCPKYENCDWKNCFDCNESCCINLNNVNKLGSIIEEDTESDV